MGQSDALQFAAGDVVRWAKMAKKRDKKGANWCKKHGFGKERSALGRSKPSEVVPIEETVRALEQAKESAANALAGICRTCGRCEWSGK